MACKGRNLPQRVACMIVSLQQIVRKNKMVTHGTTATILQRHAISQQFTSMQIAETLFFLWKLSDWMTKENTNNFLLLEWTVKHR